MNNLSLQEEDKILTGHSVFRYLLMNLLKFQKILTLTHTTMNISYYVLMNF